MEIITHKFNTVLNPKIKNINIASYHPNYIIYNVIFENDTSLKYQIYFNTMLDKLLIFEYINKSPLWEMQFVYEEQMNIPNTKITIKYLLDTELVKDFFDKSLALASYIFSKAELLPQFNKFNSETSFISYNKPLQQPTLCKVTLYNYQKK